MKKCQCEQEGRVHGTIKSTRFEDLETDVVGIKEKLKWVRELYERMDNIERRLAKLEDPPSWQLRLKRKIKDWLDIWN